MDDFIPNVTSARDLLMGFYGSPVYTQPVESTATIGTTATAIGNGKQQRLGILVSNTGATNFAIGFNPALTIATGALLLPGGTYNLDWYYDGDLVLRPLFAISSAGGGTLYIVERMLNAG